MTLPASGNDRPGYICPFCDTDCSPIAGAAPCEHFFAVDGENGWRFSQRARELFDAAAPHSPMLFRDLLYHDPNCRAALRLRRANYDDSLEMYIFSERPAETAAAFAAAIGAS